MIVTAHLCMPPGEPMRQSWTRLANLVREDNRYVIASMLADGRPIPDRIEDWGLRYVPEVHRRLPNGEPALDAYGIRALQARGTYSCLDACALEASIINEKYGSWAYCQSVAQGDDDYHGVYITRWGAMDPVARVLGNGGGPIVDLHNAPAELNPTSCQIVNGHVLCEPQPDVCAVDESGRWYCPVIPELDGTREPIGPVRTNRYGSRWATSRFGAAVPVMPVRPSLRRNR